MFRKILIAGVASLSFLSPLAMPAATQAREAYHRHHYDFRVYYRGCDREPWHFSAGYGCRDDALRAAHHLHERGFATMIR